MTQQLISTCDTCGRAGEPRLTRCPICGATLLPPGGGSSRVGLRLLHEENTALNMFVDQEEVVLGRGQSADIILADRSVSRQHVRLSRSHETYVIEDLGSTNRTFLNHQPLEVPTPLAHGDSLSIGNVPLVVELVPNGAGEVRSGSRAILETTGISLEDVLAAARCAEQSYSPTELALLDPPAGQPPLELEDTVWSAPEPWLEEETRAVEHDDRLVESSEPSSTLDHLAQSTALAAQTLAALSDQLAFARSLFEQAGGRATVWQLLQQCESVRANAADVGRLVALAQSVCLARPLLEAQLYVADILWPSPLDVATDQEA